MPLNENTTASKCLSSNSAQIGRVAMVDFKLRIARAAGFNHALRIIKSNIAVGDLRQRPRRAPAADAEFEHRRAWPDPALEYELFTGLQLFHLRKKCHDGGIAVDF